MSIVNSIETVREWLGSTVCPMVQLKLPPTTARPTPPPLQAGQPDRVLAFVPSKDRLPPKVPAPIPSVCVQIVEGTDSLTMSSRSIKIRLCFSAWDPGYHGRDIFKPKNDGSGAYVQWQNEEAAAFFEKNGEGWRDAWNFVDTALRMIENAEYIGPLRVMKGGRHHLRPCV